MNFPYYKDADKFTPTSDAIQQWLKTRKNNSSNKPGIFETTDFKKDQIWSITSFLIELSALYFTIQGAIRTFNANGNIWYVWFALITVVLFIGFDIIGIMLHGHDKAQRTINKSLYLVHPSPTVKVEIFDSLKETTMREFFGVLLLSISAVLKIGALWFFLVLSYNYSMLTVFTILYIIVIYIHASHTVYWWPAFVLKNTIRKQYKRWYEYHSKGLPARPENTINESNIIRYVFHSNANVQKVIQTCENNRIKVVPQNNNYYMLEVAGPLWDENIVLLCTQWGQVDQEALIHSCITVQLLQCGTIVPSQVDGQLNNNLT